MLHRLWSRSHYIHWNENREGHDVDIFNIIQKVQDTVIHLEVEEEQWEVTQESKRQQAERTGFLAQYLSGLRHTDAPHT